MNQPAKPLLLEAAFRVLLRSRYPQRIELADEVNKLYFHYLPRISGTLEPTPEAKAATGAMTTLRDAILNHQIPLRGRLDHGLPNNIDPTELSLGGLSILTSSLEVYASGRTLRTYTHVHCYEHDLQQFLVPPEPPVRAKGGRKPLLDKSLVADEITRLMDYHGPFSADDPAWDAQARLEEKIATFAGKLLGNEPGENTVRNWVREGLASYYAARTEI